MEYELVVLTTTEFGKKAADEVEKTVGGKSKITKTDDWGTKPLAYKILKQTEGSYFFFALSLEPAEVSPIDEALRRNDNILRHLLVRHEKTKEQKNKKTEKPKKETKEVKKVEKKTTAKKGKGK